MRGELSYEQLLAVVEELNRENLEMREHIAWRAALTPLAQSHTEDCVCGACQRKSFEKKVVNGAY